MTLVAFITPFSISLKGKWDSCHSFLCCNSLYLCVRQLTSKTLKPCRHFCLHTDMKPHSQLLIYPDLLILYLSPPFDKILQNRYYRIMKGRLHFCFLLLCCGEGMIISRYLLILIHSCHPGSIHQPHLQSVLCSVKFFINCARGSSVFWYA